MQDMQIPKNDEFDLKKLLFALWHGKIVIFLMAGVALFISSIYLHNTERTYTVTAVYKPVVQERKTPNLGGLGGLASLAGIAIPSSSTSDFTVLKALLISEEVSAILMHDAELVRFIFGSEWDEKKKKFVKPASSNLNKVKNILEKILAGGSSRDYEPPNARRMANLLPFLIKVSQNNETGYLILTAQAFDTGAIINLIEKIVSTTDDLLKNRYVSNAEATLIFYQKKISSARSREQREALAKLMVQEDQRLMLAARGKNFVVEPLTIPETSLYPTEPNPSRLLALSIVIGGFLGSLLVLLSASRQNLGEKSNA